MKCLSVKNPYAGWIADGSKTIELRSWRTHYRGPLIICASARGATTDHGMPDGVARCMVELVEVRAYLPADTEASKNEWYPDLYAWVLANPRPLPPVPVKGKLNLFAPSPAIEEALTQRETPSAAAPSTPPTPLDPAVPRPA